MEDKLFEDILNTVSDVTRVNIKQIMSKCRAKEYTDARKMISFILYNYGYTVSQIAILLNTDISTIRYLIKAHNDFIVVYKKYKYDYKRVTEMLDLKYK